MKTSFYLTTCCLVFLSLFLVWKKFEIYNHGINISATENEDRYQFSASYYAENTGHVQHYINSIVAPDKLFQSENDYMDITTSLSDRTTFYLKESPGRLKIVLDKRENSTKSYLRIKRMCDGIKELLAGK